MDRKSHVPALHTLGPHSPKLELVGEGRDAEGVAASLEPLQQPTEHGHRNVALPQRILPMIAVWICDRPFIRKERMGPQEARSARGRDENNTEGKQDSRGDEVVLRARGPRVVKSRREQEGQEAFALRGIRERVAASQLKGKFAYGNTVVLSHVLPA